MRLLIAHTNQMPELQTHAPLPGREECGDDILAFGNGYEQISHAPRMHWDELLANCPAGWRPEVYVHWSIEYNPMPEGIEHAECFLVGVVGDWNLGGQAFQLTAGAFDMLIADQNGVERLKSAGFTNAHYGPQWAFNPTLHRRLPEIERDLDIVMIGNFNHEVQRERSKWLARVAKLSRKYRVCLTSGVFGEDYVRLMNRAKIVFNHSIRGELNMRAYEAPACGALLFNERDNPEIRSVFTDRQDCVLYGEDDLEALFDYYLSHPHERERLAEAGRRTVSTHTYGHHMAQLLDTVDAVRGGQGGRKRPFATLMPRHQHLRRAWQSMSLGSYPNLVATEKALARAERVCSDFAEIKNARACARAKFSGCLTDPAERACVLEEAGRHAESALAVQPDYIVARFNLAQIQLARSDFNRAAQTLMVTQNALEQENVRAEQLYGPCYFAHYGLFVVELEKIWAVHRPKTEAWVHAMRRLLLWRVWEQWSDLAFETKRFAEAADFARKAAQLCPEIGTSHYRYARALRALGRAEQAEAEYRHALEEMPLYPEAWLELAALLRDTRQWDKCRDFVKGVLEILDGCPIYGGLRTSFESLHTTLCISARSVGN